MPAKKTSRKRARSRNRAIPVPPAGDWRSTDEQEILRRIQRAREE